MHALMGKGNKTQTPQERYRAMKQKEEEERNAFLPPGLVNHGNTCFMNSVLQGLIATPMLADIVRFSLPESYAPVASRRSPQLTNGHGLGGKAEQEWVNGMPLGDIFVQIMEKAWRLQDERMRQSMSPRELLQRIGTKYDQYLDFRQQDAHEFLRHLLDAMRMEELDIIKQRQPPLPKPKRNRKDQGRHASPSSVHTTNIPEEDRLTPFVDMVFGGRLASILVCEKCKNISLSYEDFMDLSLSIKQEDYEKSRKRDRLRTIARKLGMRGRPVTRGLDIPEGTRASSVPASPSRRSEEAEKSFELALGDVEQRRRSLEAGEETPSLTTNFHQENSIESVDASNEQITNYDKRLLNVREEFKTPEEDDEQKEGPRREKNEDGWVKLRRKITVGVGVKKSHKKAVKKEPRLDLPSNDDSRVDATSEDEVLESFIDVKAPSPVPASPSLSPLLGASITLPKLPFFRRPSSRAETSSADPSAVASPSRTPDLPPVPLPPQETHFSPSPAPVPPVSKHVHPKSPRPRKPSRTQSAYLRRLLADIPSGPSSSTNVPFNLFRNSTSENSSLDISDTRGAWPKLGHVQSLEGCLKMFTAVEVLDGENMVGCRKCWKLQHGKYVSREEQEKRDEQEDEDEEDEDDEANSSSSASVRINLEDGVRLHPKDVQAESTSPVSSAELSEGISIHSAPPSALQIRRPLAGDNSEGIAYLNPGTSSSPTLAVPSISMTTPESNPSTSEQTPTVEVPSQTVRLVSSSSRDSLQLPTRARHFRQPAERSFKLSIESDTSSISSDESGTEMEETETSFTRSDSSSIASTRIEPPGLSESTMPSILPAEYSDLSVSKSRERLESRKVGGTCKIPRSKQVVMRRAYKRYLIATPPPVLVIHFKRFQQVGRAPAQMHFFTNFKKLDDPISFPEYLNLSPYLLPNKDDVNGRSDKKSTKEEKEAAKEGCMYRLYAVVVHIGNMLGGHYVAYTVLPEANVPSISSKEEGKDSSSSLSTSSTQASLNLRPEIPRTTSFSRTANPHVHSSSKSRSSSSSRSSSGAQRQWCYLSDTTVRLATLEEVLQAKAYICMYERV